MNVGVSLQKGQFTSLFFSSLHFFKHLMQILAFFLQQVNAKTWWFPLGSSHTQQLSTAVDDEDEDEDEDDDFDELSA